MDDLDEHLIDRLRVNARASVAELARGLGLSRTTVQSRLARLERSGVIAGYSVRLAEGREAAQVHAVLLLGIDAKQAAAAPQAIGRIGAVRKLSAVAGPYDMIAELVTATLSDLQAAILELGAVAGVERLSATVVLDTKFER